MPSSHHTRPVSKCPDLSPEHSGTASSELERRVALEASTVAMTLLPLPRLSHAAAMEEGVTILTSQAGSLATNNNTQWDLPPPGLSTQIVTQDSLPCHRYEVIFKESSPPGLGTAVSKEAGRKVLAGMTGHGFLLAFGGWPCVIPLSLGDKPPM